MRKRVLIWAGGLAMAGLLMACGQKQDNAGGSAGDQSTTSGGGRGDYNSLPADNTGRNTRDRSDTALTPGDQGSSDADRETTRRIRRALTSNSQLSTDAKNIKIITESGNVTLRGTVASEEESKTAESVAQQAGARQVHNQLEVKTSNP